jgi:riboflavin kinase/FMN adenylyltransferase
VSILVVQNLAEAIQFGPCALTIGNFDGVHLGHRALMRRVVEIAKQHYWHAAALTFDPHPTRLVAPQRAPKLLTSLEQRVALMADAGIERVLVLPFTSEIAALSPDGFADVVLAKLEPRAIVVGDNFHFGRKQAGNTTILAELGSTHGYFVEAMKAVECRGRIASSTEVRMLLAKGDVTRAWRLLERPYSLEGEVVKGHGIGSKQTVPTLNLSTTAEVIPAHGVYITRTLDLDSRREWNSITNVGMRPTFDGDALTIETFLLDPFDGATPDRIRVEFLRRVREERKFETPEALKTQIFQDVSRAQAWFRRRARFAALTAVR